MTLPAIPVVDIRERNPVALATEFRQKGRDLVRASCYAFGIVTRIASLPLLPIGDRICKQWLIKTNNPYRDEIAQLNSVLGSTGAYFFNLAYEWGCTSAVYSRGNSAVMTRVLDWPFPALGKHMVVAHQRAPAGDFKNVTWPGVSGVYSAVAKGRFAAALNQAPMRRHGKNYIGDWYKNRRLMLAENGLPPSHLLRQVFETASDYTQAKQMLSTIPVCIPVIFILSGTRAGEGCVIERTEHAAGIREMHDGRVVASNHFLSPLGDTGTWSPREPNSAGRYDCALLHAGEGIDNAYGWFVAPMLNEYTRLAMVADAASGSLQLVGIEDHVPVTQPLSLP
jgi:hypothetical protein